MNNSAGFCDRSHHSGPQTPPDLYLELKRVAARYLQRECTGHILQASALVHEAWLRLANDRGFCAQRRDRHEVLAAAANMMRRILIDHARRRIREAAGSEAVRLMLAGSGIVANSAGIGLLELEEALTRLAELNARQAQVVELRYFSGMTIRETSEVLGVSDFTVKQDWRSARQWLSSQLQRK